MIAVRLSGVRRASSTPSLDIHPEGLIRDPAMLKRLRIRTHRSRPWNRRRISREVLLAGVLLVLLGLWLYDPDTLTQATTPVQATTPQTVNPSRLSVVDGDTVRLNGETNRLVGFDTPETYRAHCDAEREWGDAATERLRELLAWASSARLAYLPRRDRYGRDLARLMLDGEDVADIMVGEGLARRYSGGQRHSWC